MSKEKKPEDATSDQAAAEKAAAEAVATPDPEPVVAPEPVPTAWIVKLEGNPELSVPTARQRAAGKTVPHSAAEAWELYAEAMGITSTVHQYSASPVHA